jgi:hypothetical protein
MKKLQLPSLRRSRKPAPGCIPQANGFVWSCRYSSTDEPDNQGRWARVCHYRGYLIGWVSRIDATGKRVYSRNNYFPTSGNDMPYETVVVKTLEQAKQEIERGFLEFIEQVK